MENFPFGRIEILGLIKYSMWRRVKAIKTNQRLYLKKSRYKKYFMINVFPQATNIDNFKFNDIHVNHALSRYYQRNEYDNFISTNENKVMKLFLWKREHEYKKLYIVKGR